MKYKMVCDRCGSDEVHRDAWADWDEETGQWVLGNIFDYSFCEKCDGESRIKEVEAT